MVWVPCFSRYPCIAHKGLGQTADPPKLPGGRWHRGLRRSWPYPWGIDIENILSIKSSMNVDNLMIYLMHGDLDRVFTSKNGENMETSVDLDCFFPPTKYTRHCYLQRIVDWQWVNMWLNKSAKDSFMFCLPLEWTAVSYITLCLFAIYLRLAEVFFYKLYGILVYT